MYTAKLTKNRIKSLCETKKLSMEDVLKKCGLGVNAIRQINDKKGMASFSLAKIADHLSCSVDYLLGRTYDISNDISIEYSVSSKTFDFKSVFNPENAFTKYMYYILEARSEINLSYSLFNYYSNNMKGINRLYFWHLFRQCVLSLCETAKVILLIDKEMRKSFTDARSILLKNEGVCNNFKKLEKTWVKDGKFLSKIRNHIAHYDHEYKDFIDTYIKNSNATEICFFNEHFSDFSAITFSEVTIEIYKAYFKDNIPEDKNEIPSIIVNKLTSLLKLTLSILNSFCDEIFSNYIVEKEIEQGKYLIIAKDDIPYIPLDKPEARKDSVEDFEGLPDDSSTVHFDAVALDGAGNNPENISPDELLDLENKK